MLSGLRRRTQRTIKTLLMDQRVVAGLGNIYANEPLFRRRHSSAAALRPRMSGAEASGWRRRPARSRGSDRARGSSTARLPRRRRTARRYPALAVGLRPRRRAVPCAAGPRSRASSSASDRASSPALPALNVSVNAALSMRAQTAAPRATLVTRLHGDTRAALSAHARRDGRVGRRRGSSARAR